MYLGIDTSNYTTSLALFDGENVIQSKQLLSVKSGERGLRQSDALFQHTVNLPELFKRLDFKEAPKAVAVSTRPRCVEGSYMPCFLAGVNAAFAISSALNIPLYQTSHQTGHILAALYSAKRLDLINKPFIAFHLSGGTTEALYVSNDKDLLIKAEIIGGSSDLKAGQAVDRTGVMLSLNFPCGKELDALSLKSEREFKIKPSIKVFDCSLSGVENKAKQMLENGESPQDIAKFALTYIGEALSEMSSRIRLEYGLIPFVYMGGVMSNTLIRRMITSRFENVFFADAQFSCDNAAGVALYAYLKENSL